MTAEPIAAVARRIQRLGSLIERPEDAWLMCRMAAWAALLPALKRLIRLETLARLAWAEPGERRRVDSAKIFALSALLTGRAGTVHGVCYERSLLAYRFLAQQGADPRLVVAVRSDGSKLTGHAWVTVDGQAVGESVEAREFAPVAVFGRHGAIVENVTGSP